MEDLTKVCSGCGYEDPSVHRDRFDGQCSSCTTRSLNDVDYAKKAAIRNGELKLLVSSGV